MQGWRLLKGDYDDLDDNSIGGTFIPPQKLGFADWLIAAIVAVLAGVFSFALSYGGLPPSAWTDCSVAVGLRAPESLTPGLWRLVGALVFKLCGVAKGTVVLVLLGKIGLGLLTGLAYLMLKALLSIMIRMIETNRLWSGLLSRCVGLVATVLFLCADPVWSLGAWFSPALLQALLFSVTVTLLLLFLSSGSVMPAYIAMFTVGLLGGETPLGLISLAAFWGVFVILLRKGGLFHVKLLEPLSQQWAKWYLTFFWAIGLLLSVALNIISFDAMDGLLANGLEFGSLPLRYASGLWHAFWDAANYGAWIVGVGGTIMAFVLALSMLRRATDLEYFLHYHVGIIFFIVGILAYSQLSSLSPLWFWMLGDSFSVSSPLLLFLCSLMATVAVLCALAVTVVDAFCRDHHRLAAQINPDLEETAAQASRQPRRYRLPILCFAGVSLLLVAGSIPGRLQTRTKAMLALIDDYVREVVTEAGEVAFLFTDGHFDCGIELESARRGGSLMCIAAQPSKNGRRGYALTSLMEDELDRLSASADGANLLRTWQRDRPEKLGLCALQVGLDQWRQRTRGDYPVVSGTLAKTHCPDEAAMREGVRRTLGLIERILTFYLDGELPKECGGELRADFQFMQWRLARITRLRSEVSGFRGHLVESKECAALSDALDQRNESLSRILQTMTYLREHTMRQMTPSEGLRFALMRADFPLAHRYADAILDSDPDDADANFGIGMDFIMQEQYNRAEPHLRACLKTRDKEPAIWNNLAVLQYRQGRYEEALSNVMKALELAPDSIEVKDTLAKIKIELSPDGLYDAAEEQELLRQLSREVTAKSALKQIKRILDESYDADKDPDLSAGVETLEEKLAALRTLLGMTEADPAEKKDE